MPMSWNEGLETGGQRQRQGEFIKRYTSKGGCVPEKKKKFRNSTAMCAKSRGVILGLSHICSVTCSSTYNFMHFGFMSIKFPPKGVHYSITINHRSPSDTLASLCADGRDCI